MLKKICYTEKMQNVKKLKHDFQNNFLRLEVLFGIVNDHLQNGQVIENKYLTNLDKFLQEAKDHVKEIKKLQSKRS